MMFYSGHINRYKGNLSLGGIINERRKWEGLKRLGKSYHKEVYTELLDYWRSWRLLLDIFWSVWGGQSRMLNYYEYKVWNSMLFLRTTGTSVRLQCGLQSSICTTAGIQDDWWGEGRKYYNFSMLCLLFFFKFFLNLCFWFAFYGIYSSITCIKSEFINIIVCKYIIAINSNTLCMYNICDRTRTKT